MTFNCSCVYYYYYHCKYYFLSATIVILLLNVLHFLFQNARRLGYWLFFLLQV